VDFLDVRLLDLNIYTLSYDFNLYYFIIYIHLITISSSSSSSSSSFIVKKGAPHRQAIAVAASIDIDNNKEVPTGNDDYEASKISRNKKSAKQEELESVLNLSKWGAQIGATDDDEGFDDW